MTLNSIFNTEKAKSENPAVVEESVVDDKDPNLVRLSTGTYAKIDGYAAYVIAKSSAEAVGSSMGVPGADKDIRLGMGTGAGYSYISYDFYSGNVSAHTISSHNTHIAATKSSVDADKLLPYSRAGLEYEELKSLVQARAPESRGDTVEVEPGLYELPSGRRVVFDDESYSAQLVDPHPRVYTSRELKMLPEGTSATETRDTWLPRGWGSAHVVFNFQTGQMTTREEYVSNSFVAATESSVDFDKVQARSMAREDMKAVMQIAVERGIVPPAAGAKLFAALGEEASAAEQYKVGPAPGVSPGQP